MTTATRVLQQIAAHPRCNDLARLTRDCLFEAVGAASLDLAKDIAERSTAAGLTRADADLEFGNVFDALAEPLTHLGASALLGGVLAYSLALDPPQGVEAEDATAVKLAWLAAHAGVDASAYLDEAMGESAAGLWGAIADIVERHDKRGAGLGRADAIVAAAGLATTENPTAVRRREELMATVTMPMLRTLLRGQQGLTGAALVSGCLTGELAPRPRGPVATFFLGLFGWLLVSHVARLFGRFALQYRRPAEVSVTAQGVKVRYKTSLLGKTVRETETVIPLDGLARATREVRFPRLGTYAGLVALAVGSYVGVSWFIDGVRTASFSMATVGLLVIIVGVALDFALVSLFPGREGRCRLVFVPRKGSTMCVGLVDASQADTLLRGLAKR